MMLNHEARRLSDFSRSADRSIAEAARRYNLQRSTLRAEHDQKQQEARTQLHRAELSLLQREATLVLKKLGLSEKESLALLKRVATSLWEKGDVGLIVNAALKIRVA